MKDLALKELNKRITKKTKALDKIIDDCKVMTEQAEKLDGTLNKLESDISIKETELDELLDKQQKILSKYIPMNDFILQMNDGTYELAAKDDIKIIDDLEVIKKSLNSDDETTLLQIHFTDIGEDKYKELQKGDWCPFVDLMDYEAMAVIRFYNETDDKLIQLRWDIPRDDVIKLKDLYVKEDSFWLEPTEGEDYSYMALIWNRSI